MRPRTRWLIAAAVVLAAAAAAIAWRTARDELPVRVWHRFGTTKPALVSDRPGGEPLAGTWHGRASFKAWNVMWLWRDRPSHRSWLRSLSDRFLFANPPVNPLTDEGTYHRRAIRVECEDGTWELFTRDEKFPGEGLTDDERRLVGRWRHTERRPVVREIELELRADRTAQGSDGSSWRWLSAWGVLALTPAGPRRQPSTVVVLDLDSNGYRAPLGYADVDPDVSGTRLTAPEGPR